MSSVIEILSKIKQDITVVLKEAYAKDGITCQVNNKIVTILMKSGLEKAAKNMSASEAKQVAAILSQNAASINSAANSLTCSLKGGRRKRGGSKPLEDFLFIDGNGKKKGGMPPRRRGRSTRAEVQQEESEDEEEELDLEDPPNFSGQSPFAPPSTPTSQRNSRPTSSRPTSSQRPPASRVFSDPMPTNTSQAQDMAANLDGYEILAAFYILLVNGGLLATGAYASAIDTVAGAAGEAIGLPDLNAVCGIGRKQARDGLAGWMGMSREQGSYMSCADAQQRWETLLISLGVSLFVIIAIMSSLGSRRMDSSAYTRGAISMTYEVSMSGVTTLGDMLRGVPKGQENPVPFESRNAVVQAMTNPLRALANAARSLVSSAYGLWPTSSSSQGDQGDNSRANSSAAAEDQQQQQAPASPRLALMDRQPSGDQPSVISPTDRDALRQARVASLAQRQQQLTPPTQGEGEEQYNSDSDSGEEVGGGKKRKTRRRKARKSKKARRTRKKVHKKTRKVKKAKKGKKGKKGKKARKTKRR